MCERADGEQTLRLWDAGPTRARARQDGGHGRRAAAQRRRGLRRPSAAGSMVRRQRTLSGMKATLVGGYGCWNASAGLLRSCPRASSTAGARSCAISDGGEGTVSSGGTRCC